ncbi:tagatose kinase [Amaricoccus solimangrovi]|uniref:Sugar kinase n=1 Tax=Amaricoccus solimangrovi TaxID=2589815 RepID=A0A501WHK4_9RHOB|nr:sugar kinase [Amaricoccus solimangrovi]TPE45096.1 sugar kinase [Amaricoccus solimangrovi]
MRKIITIGEILVEIMATEIGDGFLEPISLIGPFPSGAPAIFIDQVAKLGQPCGIIARVGDDDFGRLNIERLRRDGADVSAIATDPDRPTGSAFVRYRADGTRDFVFNIAHSASGAIAPTRAGSELIESADHLHIMGSALSSPALAEMVFAALESIRARGGSVSLDPNLRKEILAAPGMREALDRVLSRTDLFLPSGEELFLFSEHADADRAIKDLLARGIRTIVVKNGAKGALCHEASGSWSVPAYPVTEVDPTGAGDTFGATFVTFWLRGSPPRESLTLATAAGALAVTRRGPMEGTSTLAEIEAFLALHHSEESL